MKRTILALLPIVAILFLLSVVSGRVRSEQQGDARQAKIEALLKERRDLLRQRFEFVEERHNASIEPIGSVIQALIELQNAELDVAGERSARIAILQDLQESFKELERIAQVRAREGVGREEDFFAARAAALYAEVQLLREQTGDE